MPSMTHYDVVLVDVVKKLAVAVTTGIAAMTFIGGIESINKVIQAKYPDGHMTLMLNDK
jgi:hypothetical protein